MCFHALCCALSSGRSDNFLFLFLTLAITMSDNYFTITTWMTLIRIFISVCFHYLCISFYKCFRYFLFEVIARKGPKLQYYQMQFLSLGENYVTNRVYPQQIRICFFKDNKYIYVLIYLPTQNTKFNLLESV